MSDLRLALEQVRWENRAFWRNPAAAFFTFAFPIMFLVIFNLVFGGGDYEGFGRPVSLATFYTPAIIAFSVVNACYTNIAIGIVFAREQGVLKRIRGTPMPPWAYLFGRIGQAVIVAVVLVVIVGAFGRLFYGVELPTDTLGGFAATVVVGAAAFSALGLAVTAIIPNVDAAPAVVNAIILPLLFVSDVFIPLDEAPAWLTALADVFPVRHLSQALLDSFNPFATGSGLAAGHLLVIGAWGLGGAVVAARFFRWEPQR